jgi:hypothetical protein
MLGPPSYLSCRRHHARTILKRYTPYHGTLTSTFSPSLFDHHFLIYHLNYDLYAAIGNACPQKSKRAKAVPRQMSHVTKSTLAPGASRHPKDILSKRCRSPSKRIRLRVSKSWRKFQRWYYASTVLLFTTTRSPILASASTVSA